MSFSPFRRKGGENGNDLDLWCVSSPSLLQLGRLGIFSGYKKGPMLSRYDVETAGKETFKWGSWNGFGHKWYSGLVVHVSDTVTDIEELEPVRWLELLGTIGK